MPDYVTIHFCHDELAYFLDDFEDDWPELIDEARAIQTLQALLEAELELPPNVEARFLFGAESLVVEASDAHTQAAVEAALEEAWDALDERADEVAAELIRRPPEPHPSSPALPTLDEIQDRLENDPYPQWLLNDRTANGLVAAMAADPAERARALDLAERVLRVTDSLPPAVATVLRGMRGTEREARIVLDVVRGEAGGMKPYDPEALFAAVDRLRELDPDALRPALLERLGRCETAGDARLSGFPGLCRAFGGTGDRVVIEAMLEVAQRFPSVHEGGALWHAIRAVGGATEAEREALLAAWPEGSLDRTLAHWRHRGWSPAHVAELLRRHAVPVSDVVPSEWPLDAEDALRSLLGDRLGYTHAEQGLAGYDTFRDAIAAALPDDEELHELLEDCEYGLSPEEVAEFFMRAGRPERVLYLEKQAYPRLAVLVPEAPFRAAASELGLFLHERQEPW